MHKRRVSIAVLTLLVASAWSVRDVVNPPGRNKWARNCTGYTIVEYGIGINCYGDTVLLQKIGGLQVLALQTNDLNASKLQVQK